MTSNRPAASLSIAALIALAPAVASAQAREPRITLSALATREHVAIDNGEGTRGGTRAAARRRIARHISVHGELTAGSGEVCDSYEGVFTSIAPHGSPLSEIERLGVVMRRDRTWKAGVGSGFGVAFHTPASQRVGMSLSLGLGGRSLNLTD